MPSAAQNKSFFHESPVERADQASHGWARPEAAPQPRHGREDAAGAAPALPGSQPSPGCLGVDSMESSRGSGCGDASCGAQAFSRPPLSPVTDIPKRVPFTVTSGLHPCSAAVPSAPPLNPSRGTEAGSGRNKNKNK